MSHALLQQNPWDTAVAEFTGVYDWPVSYCVPMMHRYLQLALGETSPYADYHIRYKNERALVAHCIRNYGSIRQTHIEALSRVPGVQVESQLARAVFAWVDDGYLLFEDGIGGLIQDFNGVMLLRSQTGGPFYAWRAGGLTRVVSIDRATISIMWRF